MVSVDKSRSCYLLSLALAADGNKQVTLTGSHLIEQVFIGFFVLVDDLFYSFVNIADIDTVPGRKELVEYLLKIPGRTIVTLIDSLYHTVSNLFPSLFEMSFGEDLIRRQCYRLQKHQRYTLIEWSGW